MQEELKPCPFCGGEAELNYERISGEDKGFWAQVICKRCHGRSGGTWAGSYNAAERKETRAWNRRSRHAENGWIPCSERLPAEYGEYLVAWKPSYMSKEGNYYEIVEYDPDDEALWIGDIEQAQGGYEVIAWQPLPEPYQLEDEEDER